MCRWTRQNLLFKEQKESCHLASTLLWMIFSQFGILKDKKIKSLVLKFTF